MSSQKSFQAILGKFTLGLEVLKGVARYNPTKDILKIAALENLKTDAETKNSNAVTTGNLLKGLRNNRSLIAFRTKESDVNCIENLIRNIASYLKAEIGSKNPAYSKVESILKRIAPPHDPKEEPKEGEEPKKTISSSEKSYNSLVGFGNDVHTVIAELGAAYNPANVNIAAAGFKAKVDALAALNVAIVKAETDYSAAVSERDNVYNGDAGINTVIPQIKDYLASFEGGKKNPDYLTFYNAVK